MTNPCEIVNNGCFCVLVISQNTICNTRHRIDYDIKCKRMGLDQIGSLQNGCGLHNTCILKFLCTQYKVDKEIAHLHSA